MSRPIDAEHFEQMLIDLIDNGDHKNAYVHHAYKMRNVAINECRKMLWEEPTVDAVPMKHGHWERIPNTPTWKCSICGYEITGFVDRDGLTPMDCEVNYCSRCGAKMDEPTQSNDSNVLDALERR